jgi:mRNA interferase MazF
MEGVRRGDLVTVALPGEFGKPRPALVVQSDRFEGTGMVTLTSEPLDAALIRGSVQPALENGLRRPSQVMVDMVISVKEERVGARIGRLEDEAMLGVTRSLAVFLGLA